MDKEHHHQQPNTVNFLDQQNEESLTKTKSMMLVGWVHALAKLCIHSITQYLICNPLNPSAWSPPLSRKIIAPKITAIISLLKLGVTITIAELTHIFKIVPPLLGCNARLLRPVPALHSMNVPVGRLAIRVFSKIGFQEKQI